MLTVVIVIVQAVGSTSRGPCYDAGNRTCRTLPEVAVPAAQPGGPGGLDLRVPSASAEPIIGYCAWPAAGIVAYLISAGVVRAWPFGPKRFWEARRKHAGLPGAGTAPEHETA